MEAMDVHDALAALATTRDVTAAAARLVDDGYIAASEGLASVVVVALEAVSRQVDAIHAALADGNLTDE